MLWERNFGILSDGSRWGGGSSDPTSDPYSEIEILHTFWEVKVRWGHPTRVPQIENSTKFKTSFDMLGVIQRMSSQIENPEKLKTSFEVSRGQWGREQTDHHTPERNFKKPPSGRKRGAQTELCRNQNPKDLSYGMVANRSMSPMVNWRILGITLSDNFKAGGVYPGQWSRRNLYSGFITQLPGLRPLWHTQPFQKPPQKVASVGQDILQYLLPVIGNSPIEIFECDFSVGKKQCYFQYFVTHCQTCRKSVCIIHF